MKKSNNSSTSKLFDMKGLSRKGRKVIGATTKPRLLTISESERQRLLSSRVANILEEKSDDCNVYLTEEKRTFQDIPRRLEKYQEKDCPLWNKASKLYEPHEEEVYLKKLEESNEKKQVVLFHNVPSSSSSGSNKISSIKSEKPDSQFSTCSESGLSASSSLLNSNNKKVPVKVEQEYELFEKSCSSSDEDNDDNVKDKDNKVSENNCDIPLNEFLSNSNNNASDSHQQFSTPLVSSPSTSSITSCSKSSGILKNIFPIFSSSQRSKGQQQEEVQTISTALNEKENNKSNMDHINSVSRHSILTDDSDFEGPKKKQKIILENSPSATPTTALTISSPPSSSSSSSSSLVSWKKKLKLDKVTPFFNINNNNTSFGTSSGTNWKPISLSKSDHLDLSQDFLSLFLEKTDADLTVYGREEKPIRVHKLFLKVRCPKLLKEVVTERQKGMKREVIPLTCFSHDAVKSLLCYIYSGRLLPPSMNVLQELGETTLDEVITLGAKYGLDLSLQKQDILKMNNVLNDCNKKKKEVEMTEKSIQTDKSGGVIIFTEEKLTQTDQIDLEQDEPKNNILNVDMQYHHDDAQGDKEEEDALMDVRNEERSFEYHYGNSFNYEFNEDFNNKPYNDTSLNEVKENSFNDKVFANKLTDKKSTRKRRRTRSEKSYKMSMSSDDINSVVDDDNDDDCVIVLDQDMGNINSTNRTIINNNNNNTSSSNTLKTHSTHIPSNEERSQSSNTNHNDVDIIDVDMEREDNLKIGIDDTNMDVPMVSSWNDSCDDAFFANLPNDEELFNYAPTSPSGDKIYSNIPKTSCSSNNYFMDHGPAITSTPSRVNNNSKKNSSPQRTSRIIRQSSSNNNDNLIISPISTLSPISHLNLRNRSQLPRRKKSPFSQQQQQQQDKQNHISSGTKMKMTDNKDTKIKSKTSSRGKTSKINFISNNINKDSSDDEDDSDILTTGPNKKHRQQKLRKSADGNYSKRTSISSSQGPITTTTATTPLNIATSSSSSTNTSHTPMLNYSLIDTPILKKELKRYGLKPLPRSKAKILLRHIYKETHK